MMGGSKVTMSNESHHNPPHNETRNQAYTGLLYVGDRPVDLEGLADRFAGLGTHVVPLEAGKIRP